MAQPGQNLIVNHLRAGQTLATNVRMRLELMSWKLAADMGGASPYDSFWMRSLEGVGTLDIQRKDLLIDIITGEQYRVFGRVAVYDQSYVKVPVEQPSGT